MDKKSTWEKYSESQLNDCYEFCEGYKDFLSRCKTERECVQSMVKEAKAAGYKDLDTIINNGGSLKPGDKVYRVNMGKSLVMFSIGSDSIENGMNILGAHLDSPRMDVKQNPLYEDGGFAYLDTHYYGGIKKYQWVTLPLAIHGVISKKDGRTIEINIGEEDSDPVFFVSDLLIHLAQKQMAKKADVVIEGEALDIIVSHRPIIINQNEKEKEKEEESSNESVKKELLKILEEQYDITEDDFVSAELEIVPAGKARDAGFDKSMILSYGQDDRVCAYTSFRAMLETDVISRTSCCILVDKEEIGSVGATGMQSKFFENSVAEVLDLLGEYSELKLKRCLSNCTMLSSDVSSGFDPTYAGSFDKKNVAYLGCGMVFNKFTGARGKSGSNDANAEYLGMLRKIFDEDDVSFQTAELGVVDLGGGGTIAYILALYGMNVIDSGVAVLNMHAPWEATSKVDVYEAYRGYKTFLKKATKI